MHVRRIHPYAHHEEGGCQRSHRKIRTILFSGSLFLSLSLSLSLPFLLKRAKHERPLNGTTVSAFLKLDPVTTRMSLFLDLFPSSWKIPPLLCQEFVHALRDDYVESSVVCICIFVLGHLCKEVSWNFGRMHAGVPVSWKRKSYHVTLISHISHISVLTVKG